jgi:hypothetical protein
MKAILSLIVISLLSCSTPGTVSTAPIEKSLGFVWGRLDSYAPTLSEGDRAAYSRNRTQAEAIIRQFPGRAPAARLSLWVLPTLALHDKVVGGDDKLPPDRVRHYLRTTYLIRTALLTAQ